MNRVSGAAQAPGTVDADSSRGWARTAGPAPALDFVLIRKLAEDLSPDAALRFLSDYLGMLPGRWTRILLALEDDDTEVALDALVSLRITSSMTGALEAEGHCRQLESFVHAGWFAKARTEASELGPKLERLFCAAPDLLKQARNSLGTVSVR
ncbi:Hpt domain-containing protein [Arthrobacter sp. BB-1]|uniref:Hpt domain-containing protein n=1 Tax=Arthrobacter sp. BB-1 TaxID=2584926 RepID=UPI0011122A88|nr:Hpt domain-containing protein [Arthrobacter sp. BB-1]TNB70484.1 Hpt domain-containing protein [Arthrobacter sp. BB-1]